MNTTNATNPKNGLPDTIIEYGLLFLIIFTPLAFGSVHVWAYTIVEALVLLLLLTWLFSRLAPRFLPLKTQPLKPNDAINATNALRFSRLVPRPSSLVPFALFLGLILFQMIPWPAPVLKHLSPATWSLYEQTLERSEERGSRIEEQNLKIKPRSSFLEPRSLSIYRNATKTAFIKFFVYFSVFFLIISFVTTTRQIRRMALTIIFTGTGVAFLALCQMLGKSDKIYGFWQSPYKAGSYGGPFINPNHLAGYLEMVVPLAIGFLISREVPAIIRAAGNWKQRLSLLESWLAKNILLVFIIVLMASAVFISGARGGILSFIFSLGLFSLLLGTRKFRRGKRKLMLLISGLILVFLLWMGIGPVVTELATLGDLKTASNGRLPVWKDTLQIIRDFPLFGAGLGNFQTLYPKYCSFDTSILWEHAHNDYVEMLADTGWAGLVLFFGGIWLLLFTIIKKWRQRRDPFLTGIALGGFIGCVSLLCHCLVEFNLHIPANAFLLFALLGLSMAAVTLKKRENESSPLPIRDGFFPKKIKTAISLTNALIVVFLLALVMKDYLAYHSFMNYQTLNKVKEAQSREQGATDNKPRTTGKEPLAESSSLIAKDHEPRAMSHEQNPLLLAPCSSPQALRRAVFFDSGNARYHYELGNYYARKMSESWHRGAWELQEKPRVSDAEKTIRYFGHKALQAYADAVSLSPGNAWYHFYLGWTLNELKRFSGFTRHQISPVQSNDAETEFSRALMLDPNNKELKKYVTSIRAKGREQRAND